jgi:hypothetical protein
MNTVLIQNDVVNNAMAFELLETQRNTLLLPQAMYLVQVLNFDEVNSHSLVALTVFQDCLEFMNITPLGFKEINLEPKELIAIAKSNLTNYVVPFYLENPMRNSFVPLAGQEYYPNEEGMAFYRALLISAPPFNKYTILK